MRQPWHRCADAVARVVHVADLILGLWQVLVGGLLVQGHRISGRPSASALRDKVIKIIRCLSANDRRVNWRTGGVTTVLVPAGGETTVFVVTVVGGGVMTVFVLAGCTMTGGWGLGPPPVTTKVC